MNESQANVAEFTVSELSQALRRTVEDAYGYVRVRGEISGYRGPHSSGHVYFALKDSQSQVRCVMFRSRAAALDWTLADGQQIVARAPDIVIGSWCGKKFRPEKVAQRPGWQDVPAVRDGQLFEIKSADILQPGPAALTDGVAQLHRIMAQWVARHG